VGMYIVCIFHMLPFLLHFECKFCLAKTMRACSIHFQLNETKNPKISQQNWRLLHPKKIREIQNEPFKISPKKIEQDKIRVLFFFWGVCSQCVPFPRCFQNGPLLKFPMAFPIAPCSHPIFLLFWPSSWFNLHVLVKGGGGQLDA
jgi:hypothetical protein